MTDKNKTSFLLGNDLPTYTDAIDDLGFLTRSSHRMHVLQLLHRDTRTRNELSEATDVSRVTLSRILSDLEDRNWIERSQVGSEFTITPLGSHVYEDLAALVGTIQVGQENPALADRLPTDWRGLAIRHLVGGDVVVGADADPMAAARTVATAIKDASSVRALVGSVTLLPMQNSLEIARNDGDLDNRQVVYDQEATAVCLGDQEIIDQWQEIEAATEQTFFYSHDETFPCNVDLIDDKVVYLTIGGASAGSLSVLRTANPAVVAWARTTFHDLRSEAVPLRVHHDQE